MNALKNSSTYIGLDHKLHLTDLSFVNGTGGAHYIS